jgi:hypothetical protein
MGTIRRPVGELLLVVHTGGDLMIVCAIRMDEPDAPGPGAVGLVGDPRGVTREGREALGRSV